MHRRILIASTVCVLASAMPSVHAQGGTSAQAQAAAAPDPIKSLVDRLELEKYKATIKGLTQFGDRRQGTDRNRAAVDWIEAQLKSYGCADVSRIKYDYQPAPARGGAAGAAAEGGAAAPGRGPARGRRLPRLVERRLRRHLQPAGSRQRPADNVVRAVAAGPIRQRKAADVRAASGRGPASTPIPTSSPMRSCARLNMQPTTPGLREEVYCTKVGTTHPEEMYIVGGHMDGHGWGEAANDDGSGTAIVMELARIFSMPDVKTERSIRFALWNNEETGLNGARAYVDQRQALQGKEEPAGSGKYPEPKWLGMIQHDMMMFDHGMPRADGTISPEQRPEADVNIEFQVDGEDGARRRQALAWAFHAANEKYATDYPAAVGPHMTNTDSTPFMDLVPAISLRENERGTQIGSGWDPHWHQPTDVFATFTDKDFRLGLNAAQTTLGAIAQLTGATVK